MLKHERPSLFMSTVWSHLVLTVKSHCAVTPSQKLPHGFCLCFFWKTEIQTPWWQGPVERYHLASDNLSKPGQKAGRGEARDNPRHQSGTLPTWRDGKGRRAEKKQKVKRNRWEVKLEIKKMSHQSKTDGDVSLQRTQHDYSTTVHYCSYKNFSYRRLLSFNSEYLPLQFSPIFLFLSCTVHQRLQWN